MSSNTDTYKEKPPKSRILPEYIDRSREQHWLAEHSQEFAGQWVALDGNHLLCHSNNARNVYEIARQSGVNRPLVVQVEDPQSLPFGGW